MLETRGPLQPPAQQSLPALGRAGAAVLLATAVAAFAAQWLVVQLWVPPVNMSTIWIPGGLLLGVTLLNEPRRWLPVIGAGFTGTTLLFLLLGLVTPQVGVAMGLLEGLVTYLLAALVRAVIRRPVTFTSLQEFIGYLGAAVLVGGLLESTSFLLLAWASQVRPPTFTTWRTFALSVVLGYLAVTPAVILGGRKLLYGGRSSQRRRVEAGILGLLMILVSGLVFFGSEDRMVTWAGFAVTLPPLFLWAALRFGPLGACAALVLISVVSTASTGQGMGPFVSESPADNTLSVQLLMLGIGVPLIALAVVVSEQRRMQKELRGSHAEMLGLNRELIAAREQEATRIARELHDDIGQRLALISIGLSRLRRTCAETAPGPVPEILQLQEQAGSLARSLRQISHQLHPAALDHVGLAASLELKCEEVRQATGLTVRLASIGDPGKVPSDIALCVYRVAQEALSNVIRHSGAHRVDLWLRHEAGDLVLQVSDDGRGLGTPVPDRGTGLGLRFAAERARAVGGELKVESTAGQGTTISVAVPLNGRNHA